MMGFRMSISISIGLVVLTLFVVSAHAQLRNEKTIQFESNNTTSFVNASHKFDGPGVANDAFFSGVSDLGKITGQGVSQSAPTGNSCILPDGASGIELKLVDHVAVTRFERSGDLLHERGKPGGLTACLNLANGTFYEYGTIAIDGGTGLFTGAHGSYDAVQNGQILVSQEGLQFGFATATYKYTLTVPK